MTTTTTTREIADFAFSTSRGGIRSIRIPSPRAVLTESVINTAATRFIGISPFDETVGSLIELVRADRVHDTVTVLISPDDDEE